MRKGIKRISIVWVALIMLFMYAPILILAVYSFTDSAQIGGSGSFSIQNYISLIRLPELRDMIVNTFVLAFGAAALSTILGTAAAIGVHFGGSKKFRTAVNLVNEIPVVNADVVTGFSICILLMVFLHMDKSTYVPMVIGHMTLCTPFVYLAVRPALKLMDMHHYEAALDLGATPVYAMFGVVIKELIPSILAGFITAVTLSLDDYFITTYTKPAVFDTISTYVVNATKGSQTTIKTALWALSTVIFIVVLIFVFFINTKGGKIDKKGRRRFFTSIAIIVCALPLTACGESASDEIVLRVANCEEYIDDGMWEEDEVIELESGEVFGENSLVSDFEDWFYETYGKKVRVEYSTYGTNEELYNQLSIGDVFDLVCPSEYMIMKMMNEDMLVPLSDGFYDKADENNFYVNGVSPYFDDVFSKLSIDGESVKKYAAGYMWGNMGLVYNPELVSEGDEKHWDMLLDPDYFKCVTMKDSVRDSFIVAMSILNAEKASDESFRASADYHEKLTELLNDTSQESIDAVEKILSDMRVNCYSLESDSGKADMITGKVYANMQWSGDAVYTMSQAAEDDVTLYYSVPEECSNMWFDGWVMLKRGVGEDADKQLAAEAFVNYISKPESVIRNMYWIGYTSAISGGDSPLIREYIEYAYGAEGDEEDLTEVDLSYFFGDDFTVETTESLRKGEFGAAYPDEETLSRCVVMSYFDREEQERIMRMWTNIRCFSLW